MRLVINLELDKVVKVPRGGGTYRVRGVVCWKGPSAKAGHYSIYVRREANGPWWLCNDSVVTNVKAEEIEEFASTKAQLLILVRDAEEEEEEGEQEEEGGAAAGPAAAAGSAAPGPAAAEEEEEKGEQEEEGGTGDAEEEEEWCWDWCRAQWTFPTAFSGLCPMEVSHRVLWGISSCDIVVSARSYAPLSQLDGALILDFSREAGKVCTDNRSRLCHVSGHHYVSHRVLMSCASSVF